MSKIIYLDAAASSLKPESVVNAQVGFLRNHYANAGRGICARAAAVDKMLESARAAAADFINAKPEQIVFTSGTTDGLNRIPRILEASSFLNGGLKTVAATDLDHHSARMPWQELQHVGKARLELCPLDKEFNIDASGAGGADVFVITAMSNVLGAAQDVGRIVAAAKKKNPKVITIVDAAQYVAHLPINVGEWDCDFLCFSGHKIGADTGIGVMYVKEPEKMRPDKYGGGMVAKISGGLDTNDGIWILSDGPAKFEAGTLPLTQIAGLPFAFSEIAERPAQNADFIRYLHSELSKIARIKIITRPDAAMLTFVVDDMHCLDFGALAGARGLCLRVGNMCASWLHRALGLDGTIRISPGFWNSMDEMEEVVRIVNEIVKK
ncbi:MAG: aminotransferase class V-fold PLP-dependent enzyme [Rickettsiales bacterium]|jgi:cysteine desulfurase/selenocysteine lyase|nr:aminotransferase class V-fold PLP-dependent enzyme [Rickettsiales bacterium]